MEATYRAERTPSADHNAQLSAVAIDPALGTIEGLLTQLQLAGIANHGIPPVPRVMVKSVNLGATPYPTIVLNDCPTLSPTWVAFDVKTGKPVHVVVNPVKAPYAVTGVVVLYRGEWMVSKTTVDRQHTCTP